MFYVNVISNYEKTKFGVEIFERNSQERYMCHEGIQIKYSYEDAKQMANEIENKLTKEIK